MSIGVASDSSTKEIYIYSVRLQNQVSSFTLHDYSDASSIPISNCLFSKEMYVKNSETDLYLAFREVVNSSLLGLALFFDVDHDRIYTEDVKILYFANNAKSDGYYSQNSTLSLQSSPNFSGVVNSISYIDGKSYNLFQFDINFNPSNNPNFNPAEDMYISDPTDYMLGFDLIEITSFGLNSWSRGNLTQSSIQNVPTDASSFFTLILAGAGKYAVPDFNPVATTQTATAFGQTESQNYQNVTNAASPGFEIIIFIVGMIGIIIRKKLYKEDR